MQTVKNVMRYLRHHPGIMGTGKSFWPGKLLDFRIYSNLSLLIRKKTPKYCTLFLARKSLISGILGFPDGDGDYSILSNILNSVKQCKDGTYSADVFTEPQSRFTV
jgi:hypothetical protein